MAASLEEGGRLLPGGAGQSRKGGNLARIAAISLLVAVAVGLAAYSITDPVRPDYQHPLPSGMSASLDGHTPRPCPSEPAQSDAP